ncbi:antirestriction protein ArdC [Bradyrhizobium sp. USDA 4509]|uniref:Zincin-like metallopeptidase domain-containing protein n=1 Tax=Bradyrhizobium brasilense TaxID=1419277 RepID=A0ABY8J807_9BRAD|nr:zincin-like metallopeptidase domain-containing protein [Bradyrhizobium brasilense]WFU61253.1 zincin-like metallopeptidase domain-containing protein [Bradyrhizobium brasilense]
MELGAAFLCAELEISNEPRQDHAQYIAPHLADKRAVFQAATAAIFLARYYLSYEVIHPQR